VPLPGKDSGFTFSIVIDVHSWILPAGKTIESLRDAINDLPVLVLPEPPTEILVEDVQAEQCIGRNDPGSIRYQQLLRGCGFAGSFPFFSFFFF
jgi:hypothetical protein